jgi:hypothetical protein
LAIAVVVRGADAVSFLHIGAISPYIGTIAPGHAAVGVASAGRAGGGVVGAP